LGSYDDIALVHGPEDAAGGNPSSAQPGVDPGLDPRRHGHGPYPVPLAGHVRQHPPSLALLEIFDVDAEQLGAAQAAAEEHGQDGPVALAGQGLRVRRISPKRETALAVVDISTTVNTGRCHVNHRL